MAETFTTRPAFRTVALSEEEGSYRLRLTLVFHPDLERIGAHTDLQTWPLDQPLKPLAGTVIGRHTPTLSDARSIDEPHVSRTALRIEQRYRTADLSSLSLRIEAGPSSDARIGAAGAADCFVDSRELKRGVPLRLGHGVVALLRLVGPITPVIDVDFAPGLLGASVELAQVRALLASVASSDLPVLIVGESGVGKELAAQALHEGSHRRAKPLVTVNMAAIPEGLAASELFGAEKGAFTGATARQGYFREAHAGSLFLDEIADTPETIQVQLLRALEQGELQVVGGKIERVDVRLIAATDGAIDEVSGFRQALLNRVAGFTVAIPPLRHRLEDIGPQAAQLLSSLATDHPQGQFVACGDDPQVAAHWGRIIFDALLHDWPGNSRELHFALRRAALERPRMREQGRPLSGAVLAMAIPVDDDSLFAIHKDNDFELKATADCLGWSRQKLYRRIHLHPALRLAQDIPNADIRAALAQWDDLADVARSLYVSLRALRLRLKQLPVTD